jgi:hypothetical protein
MVNAIYPTFSNGQRQLQGRGGEQTNDLGEYRLFGLPPGKYFVEATFPPVRRGNLKSDELYLPTFYPGVPEADRAAPVTVRGGDELSGIDISLQRAPRMFAVRGRISSGACASPEPGPIYVLLFPSQGFASPRTLNTHVSAQGTFELQSVPAGSFSLYATLLGGGTCVAHQTLEVTDTDIDGLALTLTPGVEIKGQVSVEGQLDANPSSLEVGMSPTGTFGMLNDNANGPVKADGTFLLKNVAEGNYEVSISNQPENSYLKSARMDGVDVLASGVTVDSRHTPGSLELVISPNGARLDGVVSQDEQPYRGATVALVPDPPRRGEKRLFKSTSTNQDGHFILQGIPPGDYKLFAWESIESGAYTSEEFLQPYENLGESVHITEGSSNSLKLDLIPAKDANP